MNKLFFLLIFLFLLMNVNAEVLTEKAFSENNYLNFTGREIDSFFCQEIIFQQNLALTLPEHYHFLSLHALIGETDSLDPIVRVVFGDKNVFLLAKDFKNGWARVLLSRNDLKESNLVNVCVRATKNQNTTILNDSLIGSYLSPEIVVEKIPETFFPLTGEEIKMKIIISNKGSQDAFVSLKRKKEIAEYDQIDVIKGKSFFDGTLKAGESIALDYSVKTKRTIEVQLPAAIATFTNIFGEPQTVFSNSPIIYILSNEQSIRPVVLFDKALVNVGNNVQATLAIKNNSIALFQNIITTLSIPEGISVQGERQFSIDSIAPGETKYFKITLSSNKVGSFDLSCKSSYLQGEKIQQENCPISTIVFESDEPNYPVIIGVLFLLAGIVIYGIMYFRS